MRTTGNTILITGGATGIGFALAEIFLIKGNEVLVCGRRQDKLLAAKKQLPEIHTRRCDVANAEDRKGLLDWVATNHKTGKMKSKSICRLRFAFLPYSFPI